ncbi:hypothetical protein KUT97_13525, partial [Pseudomonas aeruginosa]|nr:hypothetical protein [Pseudomonas aeruginosa]
MRLFGLLHLLGQASLRMEQALWPEDYERMTRKVKGVQREAEGDNAKSYIYEEGRPQKLSATPDHFGKVLPHVLSRTQR